MSDPLKLKMYEEKCNRLLEENEIRFAGILDEQGKLLSGGLKPGLKPLEKDQEELESFMEFVSKVSLPKEYDSSLGPINYLAARRDNAVLISFPFPISKILLLISAEPLADIEEISKRVVKIFSL